MRTNIIYFDHAIVSYCVCVLAILGQMQRNCRTKYETSICQWKEILIVFEQVPHSGPNSAGPPYVKLPLNLKNFYVCSASGIGAISSWLKHMVIYQLGVLAEKDVASTEENMIMNSYATNLKWGKHDRGNYKACWKGNKKKDMANHIIKIQIFNFISWRAIDT